MTESWVTTKVMADYFAISVQTLRKRWGFSSGYLVECEHWPVGSPQSKK